MTPTEIGEEAARQAVYVAIKDLFINNPDTTGDDLVPAIRNLEITEDDWYSLLEPHPENDHDAIVKSFWHTMNEVLRVLGASNTVSA